MQYDKNKSYTGTQKTKLKKHIRMRRALICCAHVFNTREFDSCEKTKEPLGSVMQTKQIASSGTTGVLFPQAERTGASLTNAFVTT